jgi:hypothetical protein
MCMCVEVGGGGGVNSVSSEGECKPKNINTYSINVVFIFFGVNSVLSS